MNLIAASLLCVALAGVPAVAAELDLKLYGDVDFGLQQDIEGKFSNAFGIPAFDIFMDGSAGRWSFLGELLFEFPGGNDIASDLERVEVGYLMSDALRFKVGRFHTALGYYNDAFHHGSYFEVAMGRPALQSFEDEGGLLPAHSVGIHADGRLPLGGFAKLRYDVEVANGRGSSPDEITNMVDHNKFKAVNLRLRIEPAAVTGLIIGGNVYLDEISMVDDPMAGLRLDERIFGGHIVYGEAPVHFIGELVVVNHAEKGGGASYQTMAGFAEVAYSIRGVRPYLRYEMVSFPSGAPDPWAIMGELGQRGSFNSVTAGINWVASDNVALKVEGRRAMLNAGGNEDFVGAQCAFAF